MVRLLDRLLAAACLLARFGCSAGPEPSPPDAGPPAIDSGPPVSACTGDLGVVRVAPWPGEGLQAVLSAIEPDAPVAVEDQGGEAWATVVAAADDDRGLTAVLVVPSGEPDLHSARLGLARELVRAAPPTDRVAAWAARQAGSALLADTTVDREHVLERIASVPVGESALDIDGPLGELMSVEGPWGALHRTLIVVGAEPADDETPFRPVATYFAEAAEDTGPAEAAADLLARVADDRDELVRVGACPASGGGAGPFTLRVGAALCQVTLPAWAPEATEHLAGTACDPDAAASDAFPFPREIELSFTGSERGVFEDRVAEKSKEPFRTRVRLGEGQPIPADAHLHGHTSLDCDRKSFSVDLDGSEPRRLSPGAAGDRFFLLSLCGDPGYFRYHFANTLLREIGLFPIDDGYVLVRIDGVNQGVYLLVEQPEQGLRRDLVAPRAVIRRREDPNDQRPEVKYPDDDDGAAEALSRYDELVEVARTGDTAALEEALDVGAYLRWLALASFLQVGDYVDEAFFYAAEENGAWYFRTMAWDTKDIYERCHHQGRWAIDDPCGVLYCAEADLDEAVLQVPATYGRFLELLVELPERLPADLLRETMDRVRIDLWEILADDETAAAMTELLASDPAAGDVDVARALIAAQMDEILDAAERRRADLAQALSMCPEATR